MINKGSRSEGGQKPHLRLLDLTFDNGVTTSQNGTRPHGGLRGGKKHPLSPYSYNKSSEYHVQLREDINKLFREEFFDGRGSPAWAYDISKEMTHSGESPFHIHGLLSTSKVESEANSVHNIRRSVTPASTRNTPRKRHNGSSYYHPPTPHQYLTATDTSQLSDKELKYGRPTRTTLLRARQRCASAPVNSYNVKREQVKKSENPPSSGQMNKEVFVARSEGESPHAFLTGARYNRAHLLDAKSLSVYGVYMPRTNPQGIFMTGHATQRSRDKGHTIPAVPPDSPRSDVDEASKPMLKRPSTAPGKRLLSSGSTLHPGGRPRSAWGDNSTTCHLVHGDTEKVVLVTFKGSKNLRSNPESVLPSVTGRTAPKMYYRRPREMTDDLASVHSQPPPTPVGAFSARDGSERVLTETDQENLESVQNADEPPSQSDVEERLEKIVEKNDDDVDDDNKIHNHDTLPDNSGQRDINTVLQGTNIENDEEPKTKDINKVDLHGQDSNKVESVNSEQKTTEEIFITNHEKHAVNGDVGSVEGTDKEIDHSDLKVEPTAEEEIPTQIHVTITEKLHESE